MEKPGQKINGSKTMPKTDATSIVERQLIVEFLRTSAEKLMGYGMYREEYCPDAIHWITEALESAADAVENKDHFKPQRYIGDIVEGPKHDK
jgi:hypothetical protein